MLRIQISAKNGGQGGAGRSRQTGRLAKTKECEKFENVRFVYISVLVCVAAQNEAFHSIQHQFLLSTSALRFPSTVHGGTVTE